MIRVRIVSAEVLDLLPTVYSNKLMGGGSAGARRKVNGDKQAFIDSVVKRELHDWTENSKGTAWVCRRCSAQSKQKRAPKTSCPKAEVLGYGCEVEGKSIEGPAAVVFAFCLARCDIDAPLKAVQDALQGVILASGNDRQISLSAQYLRRPLKATKNFRALPRHVTVTAFSLNRERHELIREQVNRTAWVSNTKLRNWW